jgi:hypothetical protein
MFGIDVLVFAAVDRGHSDDGLRASRWSTTVSDDRSTR